MNESVHLRQGPQHFHRCRIDVDETTGASSVEPSSIGKRRILPGHFFKRRWLQRQVRVNYGVGAIENIYQSIVIGVIPQVPCARTITHKHVDELVGGGQVGREVCCIGGVCVPIWHIGGIAASRGRRVRLARSRPTNDGRAASRPGRPGRPGHIDVEGVESARLTARRIILGQPLGQGAEG